MWQMTTQEQMPPVTNITHVQQNKDHQLEQELLL